MCIRDRSIGFGAEVSEKEDRNVGEVLKEVMPEDFIKFGLIPEFIGRVPDVYKRQACGCPDADVFFLVGGTQTNATIIGSVLNLSLIHIFSYTFRIGIRL